VVEAQANIRCQLLNLYLDGDTVIAEWEAEFDDLAQGVRKRMREIAVLVFDGQLIASLREYWASEQVGSAGGSRRRLAQGLKRRPGPCQGAGARRPTAPRR
jgi:hypothetical protein